MTFGHTFLTVKLYYVIFIPMKDHITLYSLIEPYIINEFNYKLPQFNKRP